MERTGPDGSNIRSNWGEPLKRSVLRYHYVVDEFLFLMDQTTILFRPVGLGELDLIRASGFTAFPPRLPEQPIFYPVLNEDYAAQIARDWNAKRNVSKVGYVTRFAVRTEFLQRYEIQTVGGVIHQEYWIPADELAEFNQNIVGRIEVVAEYRKEEKFVSIPAPNKRLERTRHERASFLSCVGEPLKRSVRQLLNSECLSLFLLGDCFLPASVSLCSLI